MRVVVIGAGVLGASAAFHAALAGADTALVDRADPGRATAAGAGIICPWSSGHIGEHRCRLADAGARYYPRLLALSDEHSAGETGYARVGVLAVSAERTELDHTERVLLARREQSPEVGDVTRLTPDEARQLFPPLARDLAAVRVGGGARVDGRLLTAALRTAAERCGARVIDGAAELLTEGSHVAGVRVGAGCLAADRVIVAAGAWAPALLAPLGITLAVQPQRGQITHLRLQGSDTRAWPVVLPPTSHYMLAFDNGWIVVGATRENGVGFDCRVTAAGQAEILNQALAVAPGLADATLIETRVGLRPVGPGLRPMLGRVDGLDGLVIGNGMGPSGLTIGPYAGGLLAQLARDQQPDLDLAPYDPLRRP
ncbi:MAG: FAD-dependent oxidoreductase [Acetobacteraceae bacterium]|nr:FAD-dependent oxidoreductase [Acetobacteraceae bacterium]